MEAYEIRDLTFCYPQRETPALIRVGLKIGRGEFVTVCGKSGCGKTTLLRHLKTVLTPHGARSGEVLFYGEALDRYDLRAQASRIGFVLQSPESQIVTDKVWHELAFGLESLGLDNRTIRLRVAEAASFFGIQTWFHQSTAELSGGQKQLVSLASIMAMQPDVLVLDEPTSRLDPIAAGEFLSQISKINRDLGTTVIVSEHRLEEVLPLSDRVVVMESGKIAVDDTPRNAGMRLKSIRHDMFSAMPVAMRVYMRVPSDLPCPVTVRDGREWLSDVSAKAVKPRETNKNMQKPAKAALEPAGEPAVSLHDVWFRYERNLPDAVKGLTFTAFKGELFAIVGANGTGKTTALSIIAGLQRPYRGKVMCKGINLYKASGRSFAPDGIAMLPQEPQTLFADKSVELDLMETLEGQRLSKEQKIEKVYEAAGRADIDGLLSMHPYDLSGGEQQRAGLAKVLLTEPEILLLDEPTKGMDGQFKEQFAAILKRLKAGGVTIVMVSHDIEFCARYADRCAMLFDGGIVSQDTPEGFFTGNSFYTTAANRMARHIFPDAVTAEDVIAKCGFRP